MTTAEKIRILGVALHGPRWMHPVSRDLGVNYRTVKRWDSGEVSPEDKRFDDLLRVARERRFLIKQAMEATQNAR